MEENFRSYMINHLRELIREALKDIKQDVDPKIFRLLNYYVRTSDLPRTDDGDIPFDNVGVLNKLQKILQSGKMSYLFRQPQGWIYRAMIVDKNWLKKFGIEGEELYTGEDEYEYKRKVVNMIYEPREFGFSSWTNNLEFAKNFIYRIWDDSDDREEKVRVILRARAAANKNAFELRPFYRSFKYDDRLQMLDRTREDEVVVLGAIKVVEIMWSFND